MIALLIRAGQDHTFIYISTMCMPAYLERARTGYVWCLCTMLAISTPYLSASLE